MIGSIIHLISNVKLNIYIIYFNHIPKSYLITNLSAHSKGCDGIYVNV